MCVCFCKWWLNWNARADCQADRPTAVFFFFSLINSIYLSNKTKEEAAERGIEIHAGHTTRIGFVKNPKFLFVRSHAHFYAGISPRQRPTVTLFYTRTNSFTWKRCAQTHKQQPYLRMHRVHRTAAVAVAAMASARANYGHTDTQGSSVLSISLFLFHSVFVRMEYALLVVRCAYVRTFSLFII